jgi:centrosomal protein CEP104
MYICKIPFDILSCTGSDPEFPVKDITKHGPFATGWQSERYRIVTRFCTYPQQITLKLRGSHRVFKIQLLLHHYKIPTKIDIAVASHPDKFDRLGYISPGDNSKNSYKARELKTIHIDSKCLYVQLTFHRCFVNALNLYNQVFLDN